MWIEIREQYTGFTLIDKEKKMEINNLTFCELLDVIRKRKVPIGGYLWNGRPRFKGDEMR